MTMTKVDDVDGWRIHLSSQTQSLASVVRAKLHYTDTGYGHHQRMSSQQFYNKFATSQYQSPTSRHVKMLGCGKLSSVGGGLVSVAGVRVVEFGS